MSFEAVHKEAKHMEAAPERIVSAAINYHGEIFTGQTHADAWVPMTEKYADAVMANERIDGFVTDTGRFVDRKEAALIAEKADQIRVSTPLEDGELRSEHLSDAA